MTVGLPGPRVPGEIQNPIYLDEPLWFFPELKVVMMHGGEPWEAMCVKLMLKWPNLYYMTSGFAPKHYPKAVMYYANTRGADRVMYSGYYPGLSYERLQSDLEEHVWPKFLREDRHVQAGLRAGFGSTSGPSSCARTPSPRSSSAYD